MRDRLRPSVFEDVERGLRDAAHELAAAVADGHRDLHHFHADAFAVAERLGIREIYTNDRDFEKTPLKREGFGQLRK